MVNAPLGTFRFWCQKVIPLVYDESLSYYEVLCKVVNYLNNTIAGVNETNTEVEQLKKDLQTVQDFINNLDTEFLEKEIEKFLANMIYLSISDAGYIIYHIPESWKRIKFNTTGLDITIPIQPDYGHLVLSY